MPPSTKLIANLAELDRQAIQSFGISGLQLMETAGKHITEAAERALKRLSVKDAPLGPILIFCGPGNNGGDGFVCARLLHQKGFSDIRVFCLSALEVFSGDAQENHQKLSGLPVTVEVLTLDTLASPHFQETLNQSVLWIDALFGTGLSRPVDGVGLTLMEILNQTARQRHLIGAIPHRIAVDIPSGIDAETGQILGGALEADETITFAAPKPGLYLPPGKGFSGTVTCVDIGMPKALIEAEPGQAFLMSDVWAKAHLPYRAVCGHKYTFGHVLVVAGCRRMPGAAVLCATAALKAGAGMVTLAAPESVFQSIPVPPELVRMPLPENSSGHLEFSSVFPLLAGIAAKHYDVVLIGPGLGVGDETQKATLSLLEEIQQAGIKWVLDADGLGHLAKLSAGANPKAFSSPGILTPHIGEASRLSNSPSEEINAHLIQTAHAMAKSYHATMVLKSATCIIASPNQQTLLSPRGNNGMATAGTGDVLAGLISGLWAQIPDNTFETAHQMAALGTYLLGLSGDLAQERLTPYCVTASALLDFLPQAFKQILQET